MGHLPTIICETPERRDQIDDRRLVPGEILSSQGKEADKFRIHKVCDRSRTILYFFSKTWDKTELQAINTFLSMTYTVPSRLGQEWDITDGDEVLHA